MSVRTSMTNPNVADANVWRCFCGICWRTLDKLQESAREWLETESDNGT